MNCNYPLPAKSLAPLFCFRFGRVPLAAVVLASAMSMGLATAQTQTAPAAPKTNSLGTGKSTGALLTREELRACLSKEASIRTRLQSLESTRATLDSEKASISADQQSLRAERAPLDEAKKQADAFGERAKAFTAKIESWNLRVTRFNEAKREGPQAETERVKLNQEREDISKERELLEADKVKLSASSAEAVNAYNLKAKVVDARVADWNARNNAWNQTSVGLEAERTDWVANCADRRYREDDEKAIEAGK